MVSINCVYAFLLGIISLALYDLIVNLVHYSIRVKKNRFEKHFCNDCECGFIYYERLSYKYCPYCGKELDYHIDFKDDNLNDNISVE